MLPSISPACHLTTHSLQSIRLLWLLHSYASADCFFCLEYLKTFFVSMTLIHHPGMQFIYHFRSSSLLYQLISYSLLWVLIMFIYNSLHFINTLLVLFYLVGYISLFLSPPRPPPPCKFTTPLREYIILDCLCFYIWHAAQCTEPNNNAHCFWKRETLERKALVIQTFLFSRDLLIKIDTHIPVTK